MDACRACGTAIVWALTRTGKRAPVTRKPSAEGNVLLFRGDDGEVHAATVPNAEETRSWLAENGVPLRLNHFADCPDAERFASGKPATMPGDETRTQEER